MRIAIAGGTGTVGRYIVAALQDERHEVVVLSRRTGTDLQKGTGLESALDRVEVVVDATNGDRVGRKAATEFFTTVADHLVTAGAARGVRRVVVVSIVGVDRVRGFPYYEAKLSQESAYKASGFPVAVARVTQFHEFGAQVLSRSRKGPLGIVPKMRIQPVAARAAGHVLAQLAADPDVPPMTEIAGPASMDLVDLARASVTRSGRRVRVLAVGVPGRIGAALRGGALLPGPTARIVGPSVTEWLRGDDLLAVQW